MLQPIDRRSPLRHTACAIMNNPTLRTGIVFALLQLFFTLTWTVYVIFLPRLAAEAGIAKSWIIWILVANQLVFLFADWAMGVKATGPPPSRRHWTWHCRSPRRTAVRCCFSH